MIESRGMHAQRTVTLLPLLLVPLFLSGCTQRRTDPAGAAVGGSEQTQPQVEIVEEQWPDGSLRMRKEVIRQPDGTLVNHGTYSTWHRNGNRAYEGTYVYGKLDGVERAWHEHGRKRTEQYYRNNLRHGPRYTWDPEGNLVKEENYADDKPHGTWTVWKADGTVKWRAYFDHGQPVSSAPN